MAATLPKLSSGWRLRRPYSHKGYEAYSPRVQRVTKVELIINLTAANALGIKFPLSLFGRADKVIE